MLSDYTGYIVISPTIGLCWVRKQESKRCYGFNMLSGEVQNFHPSEVVKVLGHMSNLGKTLIEKSNSGDK